MKGQPIQEGIDNLDSIYYRSRSGEPSPVSGLVLQNDPKSKISNPLIIGCVLLSNPENNYYPSPVFSDGKIEPAKHVIGDKKIKRYSGLHAGEIIDGKLQLRLDFASDIDVDEQENCSVYLGSQGFPDETPAILFSKPLIFVPSNQLVYVRSPNGKTTFPETLERRVLKENGRDIEYQLVYHSLQKLKSGNWAYNQRGSIYKDD